MMDAYWIAVDADEFTRALAYAEARGVLCIPLPSDLPQVWLWGGTFAPPGRAVAVQGCGQQYLARDLCEAYREQRP